MILSASFVLHVELICPTHAAANRVLSGLSRCAGATRQAGPGVPTYLFHPSRVITERARASNEFDAEVAGAVIGLEYFELYLDGAAFWRHAESPEYLLGFSEVTNPADRLSRVVYCAGQPGRDVFDTDVWQRLNARPLKLLHTQLFDGQRATHAGDAEYVSLFVHCKHEDGRSGINSALNAIASDPAWLSLLIFEDATHANVMRLLGVRAPSTISELEWMPLIRGAARIDGTSLAGTDAPLGDYLQAQAIASIDVLGTHFAGYTLHPLAGRYVSHADGKD